jgi:hypothetical protein
MSTDAQGEAFAAIAAIKRVVEKAGYSLHDVELAIPIGDNRSRRHAGDRAAPRRGATRRSPREAGTDARSTAPL